MASAHDDHNESGSEKTYKEQKEKVITQKTGGKVEPRDLYKLAQLTTRWDPNKELPVCLLCQDVSKKPPSQLGHIIPYSILKEAKMETFLDWIRGAEASVKKMGYRAFCPECEQRFGAGETFLNPQLFKPFNSNPDNKITVKVQADDGFPWLYYSLVSIVWRAACFIADNADYHEFRECLRGYLLNWSGPKAEEMKQKTKMFVFAPNAEVENKAKEDSAEFFFYKTFYVRFNGGPTEEGKSAWVFCGPLHIYFTYMCFKPGQAFCDAREFTAQTEEFTIEEKSKRLFPVEGMYDRVVFWGREVLSSSLRLPGTVQFTDAELSSKPAVEATHLDILPKDVSYNPVNDQFAFNTQIYKKQCEKKVKGIGNVSSNFVKVSRGSKENILFVAIRGALKNGGHLAMALSIHDGQLSYLKGLPTDTMKKLVVGVNLDTPPLLERIVSLCSDGLRLLE